MKKILLITLLSLSLPAFAGDEPLCLAMGELAETLARKRDSGDDTEERAKQRSTMPEKHFERPIHAIISFVYTMGVDPAATRKLVYLKCLAGEFRPTK